MNTQMSNNAAEPQHPSRNFTTSDEISIKWIQDKLREIAQHCGADTLTIYGPISAPVGQQVRLALESIDERQDELLVIIDTAGGLAEVAERIVDTLRHHYKKIKFLVPDKAMSAGTILVMSGDAIIMDYFSRLGPVDPQVSIEGKQSPASTLSYLEQYNRLVEKSKEGGLTTAELVLLQKLDLADLRQYELAAELSVNLIREWLQKYKFKDWSKHSSSGKPVTPKEKKKRAEEIARALSDQTKWHTHNRMISRDVLIDLKLKIDHLENDPKLATLINDYFWFLRDFASRHQLSALVISPHFI